MGKKKKAESEQNHFDVADYVQREYHYDLLNDLLPDYEENEEDDVDNRFLLRLTVAYKSPMAKSRVRDFEWGKDISPNYYEVLQKYYKPNARKIVLDYHLYEIPIDRFKEEVGTSALEPWDGWQGEDEELERYDISRDGLFNLYFNKLFHEIPESISYAAREFAEIFFSSIFSKFVTLQPSIHIPDYEIEQLTHFPGLHINKDNNGFKDWMQEYLDILNNTRKNSGKLTDAYSQFLHDSYQSIKNVLVDEEYIAECPHCHALFAFWPTKIYCSTECRKKAQNRRDYQKNRHQLKERSKHEMRDTRRFYKERGVKK